MPTGKLNCAVAAGPLTKPPEEFSIVASTPARLETEPASETKRSTWLPWSTTTKPPLNGSRAQSQRLGKTGRRAKAIVRSCKTPDQTARPAC